MNGEAPRKRWSLAWLRVLACSLALALTLGGVGGWGRGSAPPGRAAPPAAARVQAEPDGTLDASELPAYDGAASIEVDGNVPDFTEEDLDAPAETYAELDDLGRCGQATAIVGEETMPTEDRESIGMVKPSGWHTVRYDDLVDGHYLYNRCHLIGYQLSGENANERNLITGTRYMNVEGMLPYENEVADYVQETGNHVLYRVTPVFEGDELVARGVHVEAESVEDDGAGVSFNVFCYNVQPGIEIDYETGESWRAPDSAGQAEDGETSSADETTYVLNVNTGKFHRPDCSSVDDMSAHNKREYTGTRDELIDQGYEPCSRCNP